MLLNSKDIILNCRVVFCFFYKHTYAHNRLHYGGGQFNGGRKVMLGGQFNGGIMVVTELVSLMAGKWLCYRDGH